MEFSVFYNVYIVDRYTVCMPNQPYIRPWIYIYSHKYTYNKIYYKRENGVDWGCIRGRLHTALGLLMMKYDIVGMAGLRLNISAAITFRWRTAFNSIISLFSYFWAYNVTMYMWHWARLAIVAGMENMWIVRISEWLHEEIFLLWITYYQRVRLLRTWDGGGRLIAGLVCWLPETSR